MGADLAAPQTAVPDLVRRTAANTITVDDIKFDRLYIGQAISEPVQQGLVKVGDLFTAQDKDDPAPNILAKAGDKNGVVFHYLDLRKGKSRSLQGVLETWKYDDPNVPQDAWTTYSYFIAIPEAADDIPFRLLLTRTGRSAAQKINTILMRASGSQPPYELAFRITTDLRQNDKGKFYVPLVAPIEADAKSIAVARDLYEQVHANQDKVDAASAEPSI